MALPIIPCPPLPAPIQAYIDNGLLGGSLFTAIPHASSADKPRPMESWSLADHRDLREHSNKAIRNTLPNLDIS